MTYAYLSGLEQPDTRISIPKGQATGGHAIGILVLDVWYPPLPGNVANASTYRFPVMFKILKGATIDRVVSADPALLNMILEGGRELEGQGVRALVGACGYFANYQREAAAALHVPTFLSSLLQIPLITQALRPQQKVGILCADADSLTNEVLEACGIFDLSRIAIMDAQDVPEFRNISLCTGHLNSHRVQEGLVGAARQLVHENPDVGALLIECSDMPPYAWAIQNAVRLPVFDFTTMINWVFNAVVRQPFGGFL